MPHALITGGAGFIGSHLVDRLLAEGWRVTVVDNFDPFYEPQRKRRNIAAHVGRPEFRLLEADIRDFDALQAGLRDSYDVIVHLAARAGVRPSIQDPIGYQEVNVRGTQNLLELARERGIERFVFASSSSVYGVNPNVPWREDDPVLLPISPYASTKVSGELIGHVYSHLYGIRFMSLRLFTVYGPRQHPDLAIHKFARAMLNGGAVTLYGDGGTRRDYTYIGDIIEGIRAGMNFEGSRYEVINLGSGRPVRLQEMVEALKSAMRRRARIERLLGQPGDVPQTWAHIGKAERLLGYAPRTPFSEGIRRFLEWFEAVGS